MPLLVARAQKEGMRAARLLLAGLSAFDEAFLWCDSSAPKPLFDVTGSLR